jgi:hypothetical protein
MTSVYPDFAGLVIAENTTKIMQLWKADLELGRQIRNENCGPELSPAHPVVGLMNLLQREIVI